MIKQITMHDSSTRLYFRSTVAASFLPFRARFWRRPPSSSTMILLRGENVAEETNSSFSNWKPSVVACRMQYARIEHCEQSPEYSETLADADGCHRSTVYNHHWLKKSPQESRQREIDGVSMLSQSVVEIGHGCLAVVYILFT